MKHMKRILAIAGIILIAALYLTTLALSFSQSPDADKWLMVYLFATFAVPLFIYICIWLHKLLTKNDEE